MPILFLARKLKRFFIYRVLSLDDSPHRIALGVAVGIFVTWTPTIGFQMVLTVLLSMLLRANKLVGVPFVWISNPLTMLPIYGSNYLLGRWLLGGLGSGPSFRAVMRDAVRFQGNWWETTKAWWVASTKVFWPLWVGSLIMAVALGAITYVVIYHAVTAFRRRRHDRRPGAAGEPTGV